MTDRAKKISELQATTSVASTDKIVVLKDPSGTPSTRSVTANIFAQSIGSIARMDLPNATVSVGNVTVASNGSTAVAFLTVANSKFYDVFYTVKDVTSLDKSIGHLYVAANNSDISVTSVATAMIGTNPIDTDISATINATANTTTLYFIRSSATTANVVFNYKLTTYT